MEANEEGKSESTSRKHSNSLISTIQETIKMDLNIHVIISDINFAYILRNKNYQASASSPIVVSFTTNRLRNEILQKVRLIRRQQIQNKTTNINRIFYNERLSKENQEIYYQTRMLVKNNIVKSTWIFKSEVYIKKETSSYPKRILTMKDLEEIK